MEEMGQQDQIELMIARRIEPRLSAIEGKLDVFATQVSFFAEKMSEQKAENEKNHQELSNDFTKLQCILQGNGKDGLIIQTKRNSDYIDSQIWWQRLILSVVVSEVIGLIVLLIKLF